MNVFIQFQANVERLFNSKILSIQSDWGGEYRSLTNYLKTYGILHRIFCPYTHQQNNTVERKHRHMLRLVLHSSYMPLYLISTWLMPFIQLFF